jgi:G:T/U-mismatch repair DNA glycosylase
MPYHTLSTYREEQHPWPPYIPGNADKLLLGTFPTVADNHRFEFFYPSPKNRFWPIMSQLAGHQLLHFQGEAAADERRSILDKLGLGVTDIGFRVLRQNESALDHNLFPLEFCNIFRLAGEHPGIRKIILTSSGKGNSVLSWFSAYCELNGIDLQHSKEDIPWETTIFLGDRALTVAVAYSTSTTYRSRDLPYMIAHYRRVLDR